MHDWLGAGRIERSGVKGGGGLFTAFASIFEGRFG